MFSCFNLSCFIFNRGCYSERKGCASGSWLDILDRQKGYCLWLWVGERISHVLFICHARIWQNSHLHNRAILYWRVYIMYKTPRTNTLNKHSFCFIVLGRHLLGKMLIITSQVNILNIIIKKAMRSLTFRYKFPGERSALQWCI